MVLVTYANFEMIVVQIEGDIQELDQAAKMVDNWHQH